MATAMDVAFKCNCSFRLRAGDTMLMEETPATLGKMLAGF